MKEVEICKICGREIKKCGIGKHLKYTHDITLKEYYDKFYRKDGEGICPMCGKESIFNGLGGYRVFCSSKCNEESMICNDRFKKFRESTTIEDKKNMVEKAKKTKLERYGDANYNNKEKSMITCEEKYGTKNFNNLEKRKQTNIEKYGCEYSWQNESIRAKINNTKLEKYGSTKYNNSDKAKQTCMEKYGVDNYAKSFEFFDEMCDVYREKKIKHLNEICKINNLTLVGFDGYGVEFLCLKCNKNFVISDHQIYLRNRSDKEICLHCNPLYQNVETSKEEKELFQLFKENYFNEILENDRKVLKVELDIYLPNDKLAFEFNGLFWHSSYYKKSYYHSHKTDLCEKQNIHLIHIYEDDWMFKKDLVTSNILKILNKSPILYPNNFQISEISHNISNNFLQSNSLNYSKDFTKSFGLYSHNTLVYVLTMNKSVINNICEISKYKVKDGFKLIFNYLKENLSYNEYSLILDRSWYKKEEFFEGFEFVKCLKEKRYYIINNKRVDKIEESEDNNYLTIYDSGSLKYVWKRDGGI